MWDKEEKHITKVYVHISQTITKKYYYTLDTYLIINVTYYDNKNESQQCKHNLLPST